MAVTLQRVRKRAQSLKCVPNRRELLRFIDEEANRVEASTLNARLDAIIPLAEHLGRRRWRAARRTDIIQVVANHVSKQGLHLRRKGVGGGRPIADSTKWQHSVMLHFFYKWLLDLDKHERAPQFRKLPFRKVDAMANRLRVLMLTPAEVKRLIAAARSKRDRAIILVGLETGFRVSEMAALRLDYMEKRRLGYFFSLASDEPDLKSGERTIAVPVIAAKKVLEDWLEEHPRKHAAKPYLFVTQSNRSYGRRMSGASISAVVERCARRAGIRRATGHVLRHVATSFKVARRVPEDLIKALHGWSKKSTMLAHYSHLEDFFQSMIAQMYGLADTEPVLMDIIGSQACLLCGEVVHVAAAECAACGIPNIEGAVAGEQQRQRNAAVGYVAIDLAKALQWKAEGEDRVGSAIKFLEDRFAEAGGGTDDDFVKWCLVQWARECGDGRRENRGQRHGVTA